MDLIDKGNIYFINVYHTYAEERNDRLQLIKGYVLGVFILQFETFTPQILKGGWGKIPAHGSGYGAKYSKSFISDIEKKSWMKWSTNGIRRFQQKI